MLSAHDDALLTEQWQRLEGPKICAQVGAAVDPIALFRELAASEVKIRVNESPIVHGDLHISNVALDIKTDGTAEAYIFDPGVVTRTVAGRDLAVLEASAILPQELDLGTVEQVCSVLYRGEGSLKKDSASSITDTRAGMLLSSFVGCAMLPQLGMIPKYTH